MMFDWKIFFEYLWPPTAFQNAVIRDGFIATIIVSIIAQIIGIVLAVFLAIGRLSRNRALRLPATAYVMYFRGTPLLVQLSLVYFGSAGIGLYKFPGFQALGFYFAGPLQAGIVALGLNQAAYNAEIVRAGILAVDRGQSEAALSVGMRPHQVMRRIVLPQAARIILPPFGNEFNGLMKSTTLISVIGATELFNAYEQVNSILFRPFELFLAVSFYYLAFTLLWDLVQRRLEKRFSAGVALGHLSRRNIRAETELRRV